jgi:hypothetical protein
MTYHNVNEHIDFFLNWGRLVTLTLGLGLRLGQDKGSKTNNDVKAWHCSMTFPRWVGSVWKCEEEHTRFSSAFSLWELGLMRNLESLYKVLGIKYCPNCMMFISFENFWKKLHYNLFSSSNQSCFSTIEMVWKVRRKKS